MLNKGVTLKKGEDTRYSLHPLDKKSEMKWKLALRETIEDAKAQVRYDYTEPPCGILPEPGFARTRAYAL